MTIDGLFATGTFWFWSLLILEAILLLCWIEYECSGLATLSVIATAVMLQFGGVNLVGYAVAHPAAIACGASSYFVAGALWAILKWRFFVREQRSRYDRFKADWLARMGIGGIVVPDESKITFNAALESLGGSEKIDFHPAVSSHKARIYMWMTYWPLSLVWTIVNDPIRRIFREIYERIKGTLQKISDAAWAGTENDLPRDSRLRK